MTAEENPGLRALYTTTLEPYLTAHDRRIWVNRRTRWLVLIGGLACADGLLARATYGRMESDFLLMAAFGFAVVAVGFFVLSAQSLADDVRHEMMRRIAPVLGLRYEASPGAFDLERFALLGLAFADKIARSDRLSGELGGLPVDMMAVRLADEHTSEIGNNRETRTVERFSGLLVRIGDPRPAGLTSKPGLRDITIVSHDGSMADAQRAMAAGPEAAPATPTGDAAFDARFELHAVAADVSVVLQRLDAGTRAALLSMIGYFDDAPVSVGFDSRFILFAFRTKRRFEIGPLRPPMAQFERMRHLANQVGILAVMAGKLQTIL